ncbi:hypothetical protein [uncultured Treponema sp.]|uniref:hypothetical protein n=1 Tax=uncultured Treponema sp. TaxID=162155 RepID=UPI0025FE2D15|nr:hypothetical protein [uncultured Treponema sp.]
MRFSVFAYSQEKLLEYGLDVTDALILDWFANFFIGKMEKRIFKDSSDNSRIFGWVKISKIMEDLPVIGITSEKGIRRRFDAFVEKGLMQRETVITQGGKRSYYRTTELYDTLLNTKASEKTESKKEENSCSGKIPQRNSTTFARKENPQGTKKTYAEPEKTSESPHRNSATFAERNGNTHAQGNSSSYALNDSSTTDSPVTDSLKICKFKKSAVALNNASEKIFGKSAFDDTFPEKAAAFFIQNKMQTESAENYLEFIRKRVAEKKPANPRGLAYRLFFQNDILQEFRNCQTELSEKAAESEKYLSVCPVCGKEKVNIYSSCPECGFDMTTANDDEKLEIARKIWNLPPEKKKLFKIDEENFIRRKLSLGFARLADKATREQLKTEMSEIYRKYGIEA